jgi:hypothetical protein
MLISKDKMAKLLNRSLTQAETDNFDLYLDIATERLEELLCMQICGDDAPRTFATRCGYRTLFVDPFQDITTVTVDDEDVTEYVKKQNDKYSASWYNSIEFETEMTGKLVEIDATWGFPNIPADLQLLLAKLFAFGSVDQQFDSQVKSKKIEDFTVTFKDSATYDEFISSNQSIIDKYSLCNVGRIDSGRIPAVYDDGLYIFRD